jgi:UDP-glucose-4-epimerase GalE
MKVLVTGGAGYVGSHCVRLLHRRGHEVVVYDSLLSGHRQALPHDVPLVRGNLLDRHRLADTFRTHDFDAVLHFAALLNVNESLSQPRRYYENNVLGTLNLIGEMMAQNVNRIVFSSTCAVYGTPDNLPLVESESKYPISPYGRTKWVVEMALQDCAIADGLGSISLRYFNAAGASSDGTIGEDHDPEIHLIPLVLQVAQNKRENIRIFGTDYPTRDGTAVRDYIHVEDLAEAHLLALDHIEEGAAQAFNLGTGTGTTVREIVECARRVTGHAIPAVEEARREGDPPELYANCELIRDKLGWSATHDLESVVSTAWRWHTSHPHGFDE